MDQKPDTAQSAAPTMGTEQCRVCTRRDGVRCAYVDGEGRICSTDWCPDHVAIVRGQPYCRRHAPIVVTMGVSEMGGHLPDIDNRAHSLAVWVGNDLDAGMRAVLDRARRPETDERPVVEVVAYVFTVYRTHLWERSWKLVDSTGVVLKVSVDVDEANDSEVRLRIGRRTIMSMVPPWIEHRFAGPRFASDVQARREFYATLVAAAQEAVDGAR